jgi:hypothetical protein
MTAAANEGVILLAWDRVAEAEFHDRIRSAEIRSPHEALSSYALWRNAGRQSGDRKSSGFR